MFIKRLKDRILNHPPTALIILALPGLLHFFMFKYVPLFGNVIAFQDFDMFKGITGSKWIGFDHFVRMFSYEEFYLIVRNTLVISFYSVLFVFPAPIIIALFLNEIRRSWYKRTVQTMMYLPHFLSWIIIGGIFLNLLELKGIVNQFIGMFGVDPIQFLVDERFYRSILITSDMWKDTGWSMIIYLAAIAGINPNLYEAAMVDGAGRFRQMWNVTLPSLLPAIVVMFLIKIGNLLELNIEQMLVFLNPLVRDVGEVLDTYVYRLGLLNAQFSYTTAIGIFKSIIGFALIVSLNRLSKRATGESIY